VFEYLKMCVTNKYTHPDLVNAKVVMLYKKGDPTLLDNWRPIALARTLYKIHSTMLTRILASWVYSSDAVSNGQDAFQPAKNCTRLMYEMLLQLDELEGPRRSSPITYHTDFAGAYDSVEHQYLWQAMDLCGMPPDFVEVVRSIYNVATMQIETPVGRTGRIPVGRGILQGDPMSCLLFVLYVETLLRTLAVSAPPLKVWGVPLRQHMMFADDLCGLALTPEDFERGTAIIDEWCKFVRMDVRQSKGGVLLPISGPVRSITTAKWLACIGRLTLGGDPFTVCGYSATPSSDGHHNYTKDAASASEYPWFNMQYEHEFDAGTMVKRLFSKLEAKDVKIKHTWASSRQRRRYIEQNIIGSIQYTADVPLLRLRDLTELDEHVARCIKHIMGLPMSFPIYAVYLSHVEGGLDFPRPSGIMMERAINCAIKVSNACTPFAHLLRMGLLRAKETWDVWSVLYGAHVSTHAMLEAVAPQDSCCLRLGAYLAYGNLQISLPLPDRPLSAPWRHRAGHNAARADGRGHWTHPRIWGMVPTRPPSETDK
jgi:hypothetical protein